MCKEFSCYLNNGRHKQLLPAHLKTFYLFQYFYITYPFFSTALVANVLLLLYCF